MSLRQRRPARGATLALVVIISAAIVLVGLGIFAFLSIFGGSRELQNATDSGSLNVAKQALKSPSVSLSGDFETSNFSGLTDANGNVDLLTYNRIFGQALLVAINAQVEGTTQSQQNASSVISAIYSPTSSISQRLRDSLNLWDYASTSFQNTAAFNSSRMLPNSSLSGLASTYQIAYVDQGSPTNLYIDPTILPSGYQLPSSILSSVTSPASGQAYIKGYTDIAIVGSSPNQLPTVAGATVNPKQQPHLISQSTFQSSLNNPVQTGAVPPNAFQSAAQATANLGNGLSNISNAEVGTLTSDYPACIPGGYIVIKNGQGLSANGTALPSNESIFNNQLFTGIFIANNGVFSTDESQILSWTNYNTNGHVGQAPSTDGLFNVQGAPVSSEQNQITALGGNGYPTMADYTNVQGPNANPAAAAMLAAFETAYPAPSASANADGTLTSVEELKAQVMAAYVAASSQQITTFTPGTIPSSGMRIFNHNQQYPTSAGQSPEFTTPGNIAQLCAQADPNGSPSVICSQLKQRMREINPSVTDAQMNPLLGLDSTGTQAVANSAQTINLGETWYIYLQNNNFVITQTAPPWVTNAPTADGLPQTDNVTFDTIGLSIDPIGEAGFNQTLFADQPNPDTNYVGTDQAIWQPSCGYYNLLGQLSFNEMISTSALTLTMSTAPSPTAAAAAPSDPAAPVAPSTPVAAAAPAATTSPITIAGVTGANVATAASAATSALSTTGGTATCSSNNDLAPLTEITAYVLQAGTNLITSSSEHATLNASTIASTALANYQANHPGTSVQITSLSITWVSISPYNDVSANFKVTLSDGCSAGTFSITN